MGDDDKLPEMGMWKVVIYDDERFVRTDQEWITHAMAKRRVEKLNSEFTSKRMAAGK
jgi:hypothetical protein